MLAWYAERRNYVPPAGRDLHAYDALVATDSYDGKGSWCAGSCCSVSSRRDTEGCGVRLTLDGFNGFTATDDRGRRWTCFTVTTPDVYGRTPPTTHTYWYTLARRKKAS